MYDILLSIIIPAYNAEKFIGNLLDRLVSQCTNLTECEVIVVNDGSIDRTKEIVQEYVTRYHYIHLISQGNKGESGARNTGIDHAIGEYIYFLDCDDSVEDDTIGFYLKCIRENSDIELFLFGYNSFYKGKKLKSYIDAEYNEYIFKTNQEFLHAFLSKRINSHICSIVVTRNLIKNNSLYFVEGMRIGADLNFLLRLFKLVRMVKYSARPCFKYQIRDDSIMQGYKTYTIQQYQALENFQGILLSADYQMSEISHYANFWIETMLLYNIRYYLLSNVKDKNITQKLIQDCDLLKRPISDGKIKYKLTISIAKILPIKLLLQYLK